MIAVLQHFGIGDVIFSQTAIRNQYGGEDILWPVLPGYVEGLNKAYPDISFVDSTGYGEMLNIKEFTDYKSYQIVPLRWSYDIIKVPFWQCMMSKYMLFGLNWETWKEKAFWHRTDKEDNLFNELGLQDGNPYALINTTFGSDFQGRVNIKIPRGVKVVTMRQMSGYSLFDWARVIQRASVIHTVSTSIIYMLEMLDIDATAVHIYIRRPHELSHKNYDYILKRHHYILHP